MQMRLKLALGAALLATSFAIPPAIGAGGGGGGGTPECSGGKVWDANKQKCVTPKKSEIDDDSLFEAGRKLAYAGKYEEAIKVLELAANQEDPRILNFLGYSNRKLGRVLIGLGYYEEALRIDPNYTLVREYLGEAHLQMGDVDSAKGQLAEIEKRCGKGCEEYAELSRQIADFESKGG